MDKNDSEIFSAIAMMVILIIVGFVIYIDYSNCSAINGSYVRGLFWFECIGVR